MIDTDEKQVKILVVDDDDNLRGTLSELLELEGYDVYQAGSAKECMSLVENDFFNVILMDYNLVDGTGLDVVKNIRRFNTQSQVNDNGARFFKHRNQSHTGIRLRLFGETGGFRPFKTHHQNGFGEVPFGAKQPLPC